MDHQTSSVPPTTYNSPQSLTQSLTEFPQMDSGLAVSVFTQGDDPIACLNKAMAFLTAIRQVQEGQAAQATISNTAAFQTEDLDA
ncbi:hypothetical protein Tco_0585097 [Tanacetum coccineum]